MTMTVVTSGLAGGSGTVSSSLFGGIFSTFRTLSAFDRQGDALGIQAVRWPGGTRGELARDVNDVDGDQNVSEYLYSLTAPDVMLVPGKGLSDMLAYTSQNDVSFAMFTPTVRYFGDPDSAFLETRQFLIKLLKEDAGGYGNLPDEITLEIGCESVSANVTEARQYGIVADAQLAAIRSVLSDPVLNPNEIDIKLAVQLGPDQVSNDAIISCISVDNLAMIDAVVKHHLTSNIRTMNTSYTPDLWWDGSTKFDVAARLSDAWQSAIHDANGGGASPQLESFVSAWSVGNANESGETALAYQDYGARQGRTTIDTFAHLVAAGVDAAALWGVSADDNPNWFSRQANGQTVLSHGGEVFRLMSESLVGKTLMGNIDQPIASGLTFTAIPYWSYSFEDSEQIVVFLSANDILGPQSVHMDFVGVAGLQLLSAVRVGTSYQPGVDLSIIFPDERRLYEIPTLGNASVAVLGNSVNYTFTQDYEVVRIVLAKASRASLTAAEQPDDGIGTLLGTAVSETLTGSSGKDRIYGGAGNDDLAGRSGDDTLRAGGGDDVLEGGSGFDVIDGGEGTDTAVFRAASQIRVDLEEGKMWSTDLGRDYLKEIENVVTGVGNDKVYGNAIANVISGGAGDDTISGRGGHDTILGGDGNDLFLAERGNDSLDGGSGRDAIRFYGSNSAKVDLEAGNAAQIGSGTDLLISIEDIVGAAGNDTLLGSIYSNILNGADGDDLISGRAGADILVGGRGNDTLVGGSGHDTLTGGQGADVFVFQKAGGRDVVTDFHAGVDRIALLWSNQALAHYAVATLPSGTLISSGDGEILLAGTVVSTSQVAAALIHLDESLIF